MRPVHLTALLALASIATPTLAAQDSAAASHRFPFTREQNTDGARYVWFIMTQTGLPYPYVPAKDLPTSDDFREVPPDSGRAGDVAWWPDFVAIYGGRRMGMLFVAGAELSLDSLVAKKGPPKFFRKLVPR